MSNLSKKEYCALEILKAMIANPEFSKDIIKPNEHLHGDFMYSEDSIEFICSMASDFLKLCNDESL